MDLSSLTQVPFMGFLKTFSSHNIRGLKIYDVNFNNDVI